MTQENPRKSDRNEDLVSAIIPAYDEAPRLRRCLNSVLAQTYGNVEIIVVDDGSTDSTWEICLEYSERFGIDAIRMEHKGLSSARNAGLDVAKGKWISFVDADDTLHPRTLEILVGTAKTFGADYVQCGHSGKIFDEKVDSFKVEETNLVGLFSKALSTTRKGDRLYVRAWGGIFSYDLIGDARFTEGRNYEDWGFFGEVMRKDSKVALVDAPLYAYMNDSPNRITKTETLRNAVDEVLEKRKCLRAVSKRIPNAIPYVRVKFWITVVNRYGDMKKRGDGERYLEVVERTRSQETRLRFSDVLVDGPSAGQRAELLACLVSFNATARAKATLSKRFRSRGRSPEPLRRKKT